jgi:hypothetical protein
MNGSEPGLQADVPGDPEVLPETRSAIVVVTDTLAG